MELSVEGSRRGRAWRTRRAVPDGDGARETEAPGRGEAPGRTAQAGRAFV